MLPSLLVNLSARGEKDPKTLLMLVVLYAWRFVIRK